MTQIDLLLPLRLDTPPGDPAPSDPHAQGAALRQWLAQPPLSAVAPRSGVWQAQRTDVLAAAALARTTGGAYAESSRDLQRGLDVIEWHRAPAPRRTGPHPNRR